MPSAVTEHTEAERLLTAAKQVAADVQRIHEARVAAVGGLAALIERIEDEPKVVPRVFFGVLAEARNLLIDLGGGTRLDPVLEGECSLLEDTEKTASEARDFATLVELAATGR
jgi:hypothetical protein